MRVRAQAATRYRAERRTQRDDREPGQGEGVRPDGLRLRGLIAAFALMGADMAEVILLMGADMAEVVLLIVANLIV